MCKNKIVKIGQFNVDLMALFGIDHRCEPRLCKNESCCTSYEICVDDKEIRNIVSLLKDASDFAPHLRSEEDWADLFDPVENDLCALETDEDGLCVFAFGNKNQVRCSLHAAAMRLDLHPYQMKPKVCSLWPVAWVEGERPLITIQDDAFTFPCNQVKDPKEKTLCPAIAETIQSIFGQEFYKALCQLAKENL